MRSRVAPGRYCQTIEWTSTVAAPGRGVASSRSTQSAASPALVEQLQQHVRGKLAPYEYPKEIEFIAELPMTTTGKVQRRVLREREQARG